MTVFLGLTGYQYYEDSRPLITAEVHSLLSENKLAFDHWKRSRIYNTIAFTSGAVALGTAIGIVVREKDNPAPTFHLNPSTGFLKSKPIGNLQLSYMSLIVFI